METVKCSILKNQDPDYSTACYTDINKQNVYEKNACTNTSKKIFKIIETEFSNEIDHKKAEIYKIFKNLNKACKMMHYLRFAVVTDYYTRKNLYADDVSAFKQTRLHNALKYSDGKVKLTNTSFITSCLDPNKDIKQDKEINNTHSETDKSSECNILKTTVCTTPSATSKIKRRIIIGNISKWISPDFRENNASHKWTIYIRDSQKYEIGQYISKVRLFLHPSYKPQDVIELTSPPFHLSRYGWGEFPVRVQLHFKNNFNKPVDVIHHLKLDRTFTGLQTIGSETIIDLWINVQSKSITTNLTETISEATDLNCEENKNYTSLKNYHFLNDHDYTSINLTKNKDAPCPLEDLQKDKDVLYVPINADFEQQNLTKESNISSLPELLPDTIHHTTKKSSNDHTWRETNNSDCNISDVYLNSLSCDIDNSDLLLINLLKQAKLKTLFNIFKLIVRKMPLITKQSADPHYKMLHPYACESYQIFKSYSKGKQQSMERYRAKCALNIMKNIKLWKESCSTKEFIIWTRRYGYSPHLNFKKMQKVSILSEFENSDYNSKKHQNSSTMSNQLIQWLSQTQQIDQIIINNKVEDDDEIEVQNDSQNDSNSLRTHNNIKSKNGSVILMEYPETQDNLKNFVCKYSQKIGIKLTNEEIIPGVLHCSAGVMISTAVECFIDDLIRLAFSCAVDKYANQENSIFITADDVRMALLKREEFEIFTNAGLGSEG